MSQSLRTTVSRLETQSRHVKANNNIPITKRQQNMRRIILATCTIIHASSIFALSTSDNLGSWRQASYSEQAQLCENMANRLNKPELTASSLCACILQTAGDGGADFMKVSETAAACSILMK